MQLLMLTELSVFNITLFPLPLHRDELLLSQPVRGSFGNAITNVANARLRRCHEGLLNSPNSSVSGLFSVWIDVRISIPTTAPFIIPLTLDGEWVNLLLPEHPLFTKTVV